MNAVVLQCLGPYEGLWEGPDDAPTAFNFTTFDPWTMNATKLNENNPMEIRRATEYVMRSVTARYGSL